MQSQIGPRSLLALRQAVAVSVVLGVDLAWAWPGCAGLESGVYQTIPGSTVEERGDRVPNGSRVVPFSANVTFDLGAALPSLTAVIPNAVLEGGDPFALTVRSSSGAQLMDGTYQFTGDYLRDIYPAGTQYFFDWKFSTSTDGGVVWNGVTGWAGGHIWEVTISDIALVPEPGTLTLIWAGIGILWACGASQKARNRIGRAKRGCAFPHDA